MSEIQGRRTDGDGRGPGGRRESGHSGGVVICQACDWRYLVPEGAAPAICPHCASSELARLEAGEAEAGYEPELVVPYVVSDAALAAQIAQFAQGIPFPPPDLDPAILGKRLQRLYLPMWLVDSDVAARWSAEVGFDYEVVSHQERYADGAGWRTNEVEETRIRWEPRVGTLQRRYENRAAPAQEAYHALQHVLGTFRLSDAVAFTPDVLDTALMCLPDRTSETAWPDAELGLRQSAAQECQDAAKASHIREFRWTPVYGEKHWTLLLLPVLATAYLDDDGQPQRVLVNGQTGQVYGAKRGSMARAGHRSLIIGAVALAIFVLGLVVALLSLLFPPLLAVGIVVAVLAIPVGIAAAVPVARVWTFNRREARQPLEV